MPGNMQKRQNSEGRRTGVKEQIGKDPLERFTLNDVAQVLVGSFAGALAYAYTDFMGFSDSMPAFNVGLVVLMSLFLAFAIAYLIGVRRLGHRKMLLIFGFMPLRTAVHYVSALLSSAFVLYVLFINNGAVYWGTALRRIIVIALPATVFGSAVDLIGSQGSQENK